MARKPCNERRLCTISCNGRRLWQVQIAITVFRYMRFAKRVTPPCDWKHLLHTGYRILRHHASVSHLSFIPQLRASKAIQAAHPAGVSPSLDAARPASASPPLDAAHISASSLSFVRRRRSTPRVRQALRHRSASWFEVAPAIARRHAPRIVLRCRRALALAHQSHSVPLRHAGTAWRPF